MSAKKRERMEVIYDILKAIQDNANSISPTPLLRRSNLSTQSFAGYFAELLEKGFVREIAGKDGKRRITLTDSGFRYLEEYKRILAFIEEFNL